MPNDTEEDMKMAKGLLDSIDSHRVEPAKLIELSCNMYLHLEDEVTKIEKRIQEMGYQFSPKTVTERVSEFLRTLIWFKKYLHGIPSWVLTQQLPKSFVLHKSLFTELCDELFQVEAKQDYNVAITSDGAGKLSRLCNKLGRVIERRLYGSLDKDVVGRYVIAQPGVIVHSLSEILGSEELARQKDAFDVAILAVSRGTLVIRKAVVNPVAAEIVLPRLKEWRTVVFENCTFNSDAMFNTINWARNVFKGEVNFRDCVLPDMLKEDIVGNMHTYFCSWT